jgi:ABC-type transport system substrate-binding protein
MRGSSPKFTRRVLAAAVVSSLVLAAGITPAMAATPKDTLVLAFGFDDIITMDPAEAFELSAGEIMGNVYDWTRVTLPKSWATLPLRGPSRPTAKPTPSNSSPA